MGFLDMDKRQLRASRIKLVNAIILVIFSFTSLPVSSVQAIPISTEPGSNELQNVARPNIRLDASDSGIQVGTTDYRLRSKDVGGRLVSIDGRSLKDKKLSDIERLLWGRSNSSVELTMCGSDGTETSAYLTRLPVAKENSLTSSQVQELFRNQQNDRSILWSITGGYVNPSYESNNLDLYFIAEINKKIDRILQLPDPGTEPIFYVASDMLLFSDSIGDLKTADRCLHLLMANQGFSGKHDDFMERRWTTLIKHLVETGRYHQADALCKNWIAAIKSEKRDVFDGNLDLLLWRPLKLLASCQLGSAGVQSEDISQTMLPGFASGTANGAANREAIDTLNELFDLSAHSLKNRLSSADLEWLANAFTGVGDVKSALTCFESMNPAKSLVPNENDEFPMYVLATPARQTMRLAKLQNLNGDAKASISTLQNLLQVFDKYIKLKDRVLCERLPCYYPAPSDIELQLAKVYLQEGDYKAAEAALRVASVQIVDSGSTNSPVLIPILQTLADVLDLENKHTESVKIRNDVTYIGSKNSTVELSNAQKFQLFSTIYRDIENNDKSHLNENLQALEDAYTAELPMLGSWRRPLNLFCSMLEISRLLADKKSFNEANAILDFLSKEAVHKELTPAVIGFLNVEKAINAELSGRGNSAWEDVDNENCLVQQLISLPRLSQTNMPPELVRNLRIQENLRRFAALYCAANCSERASILIERAHKIHDQIFLLQNSVALDVTESTILLLLDESIIRANQGKVIEAQRLALDAISRCDASIINDPKDNLTDIHSGLNYKTAQLVQTLLSHSGDSEALRVLVALEPKLKRFTKNEITSVAARSPGTRLYNDLGQNSIIHAYLAKELLQRLPFEKVAEAKKSIELSIEETANDTPLPYFMVAVDVEGAAYDLAKCAHYYSEANKTSKSEFGLLVGCPQPAVTLKFLWQALYCGEHAPNFDRLELANLYVRLGSDLLGANWSLENCKVSLPYFVKASKLIPDSESRKVELLEKIIALQSSINDSELSSAAAVTQKNSAALTKLNDVILSAKLAEKNDRFGSFRNWLNAAEVAFSAQLPDKGIEYCRHGIELFKTDDASFPDFRTIMSDSLVKPLVEQGRAADADSLSKLACGKISTVYGAGSAQTAIESSQYFTFLLSQKRDADAIKVLDQIISMGMPEIEIGSYSNSALKMIYESAQGLAKDNRGDLATLIINKILVAQKHTFDQDDFRISDTLIELAKIENTLNNDSQAVHHWNEALTIKKLYLGEEHAAGESSEFGISIFDKLGNDDEVKRLKRLSSNIYNVKSDVVDPEYFSQNKRIGALYQKWMIDPVVSDMQSEYEEACKQAPYSARAISALDELILFGQQHGDWHLVASYVPQRIEILKRIPDANAGRTQGCISNGLTRMNLYHLAVEANLKLQRKSEAEKWLHRAMFEIREPSFNELTNLAALEIKAGNHKIAVNIVNQAERNSGRSSSAYDALAGIWSILGEKTRANKLFEMSAQARIREQKQSVEATNSPLNGLQ
jgi:hypothetical protein